MDGCCNQAGDLTSLSPKPWALAPKILNPNQIGSKWRVSTICAFENMNQLQEVLRAEGFKAWVKGLRNSGLRGLRGVRRKQVNNGDNCSEYNSRS